MNTRDEDVLRNIDRPGPSRIQVIDYPSKAQLEAIPLGSDVVYTDKTQFAAGPLTEGVRNHFLSVAGEEGKLNGFLAYLAPAPTPDSALSAEEIAQQLVPVYLARLEDGTDASLVLSSLAAAAVHKAREGMLFPPF